MTMKQGMELSHRSQSYYFNIEREESEEEEEVKNSLMMSKR
jgi:hypothetical protein